MRYLQNQDALRAPKKDASTKRKGKTFKAPEKFSPVETGYACGDGTPGNDKCYKITRLKRGPLPRLP